MTMLTLAEAQGLVPGASLVGDGGILVERVHTDTRTLRTGDLFVALRGERFDAHDFLSAAKAAGAVAAIAERGLEEAGSPGLQVADTQAALTALAGGWRRRFELPLIAVTGSNGKTTVTQMIASILDAWRGDAAFATAGNLNNHIGVPLMLLRLRASHVVGVLELGMNHPGEIDALAALVAPRVALVNNAQREHQEFMASVEAVARENGAAIEALPADGIAVIPAGDPQAAVWRAQAGPRRVLTFALDREDVDDAGTLTPTLSRAAGEGAFAPSGDAAAPALARSGEGALASSSAVVPDLARAADEAVASSSAVVPAFARAGAGALASSSAVVPDLARAAEDALASSSAVVPALAHAGEQAVPPAADAALPPLPRAGEGRGEGAAPAADVEGGARRVAEGWALDLRTSLGTASAHLKVAGRHNLLNALAATAAAIAVGCPIDAIVRGLDAFVPVAGRSEPKLIERAGRSVTLIDDSYNANPDSVRAAIDVLAEMPGPRWLVLGDMGEVGDAGPAFHHEVGAYAKAQGIELLWTVGRASTHAAEAFGRARHFDDVSSLVTALADAPECASIVVKGSRFMQTERIVAALLHASEPTRERPAGDVHAA